MRSRSPRYGPLVSALGAILVAVSVFLPWYGLSLTATGAGFAQQLGDQVATRYGNATLQSYMSEMHTTIGSLIGHQLVALNAHQTLKQISVLLLILASLVILLALFALAREEGPLTGGEGGLIALLGLLALACVCFRMIDPPNPLPSVYSLSLREGSWLTFAGSVAMVLGGLSPMRGFQRGHLSETKLRDSWSELSGWTPGS